MSRINVKEINVQRIIKLVRDKEKISRVDISQEINIPQPTVTRITDYLLNKNILMEAGRGKSNGGRKPILLAFNPEYAYSVGVEIGRKELKIGVTNLNGDFLSFRKKETEEVESFDQLIEILKEELQATMEEGNIAKEKVLGVGIGMPGPINEMESLSTPPNYYKGGDIPITRLLEEELDFPVIIDNDANVAAMAEKWFGQGGDSRNFVYILADDGVGSGLIINEQIYGGVAGEAGEMGHSTINIFGEKCSCGSYGCLETFIAIPVLEKKMRNNLKSSYMDQEYFSKPIEKVKFHDIVEAAQKGSPGAQNLLREAGTYLGAGTANLLNIISPEIVILGGRLGKAGELVTENVIQAVQHRVLGKNTKNVHVVQSILKEGVVLGASSLVINDSFSLFSYQNKLITN